MEFPDLSSVPVDLAMLTSAALRCHCDHRRYAGQAHFDFVGQTLGSYGGIFSDAAVGELNVAPSVGLVAAASRTALKSVAITVV